MSRTKPQRLTGKAEIERLIKGFGGRFGDQPSRLVNRVKLPSENTNDLKQKIKHAKQLESAHS